MRPGWSIHLSDPDVVAAEVCWPTAGSSRELYEQRHIPEAIFLRC